MGVKLPFLVVLSHWAGGEREGQALFPLPCLLRQPWGECQMLLSSVQRRCLSGTFRARTGRRPKAARADKGNGCSWAAWKKVSLACMVVFLVTSK